ncbi:MAG: hypothetical protein E7031_03805 [Akkermansiaceae bacterium]|nr:hypothetical protein [Akkermansiaceae bacterium]
MKVQLFSKIIKLCVVAALSGLMVSCVASTPYDRISKNPYIYSSLPQEQQLLVQQGRIERGMSPDAVYLAWGAPNSEPVYGEKKGVKTERWIYLDYEPVTVMSAGGGFTYGYPGWYGPFSVFSGTAYVPSPSAYVEFENGKVTEWEKKGY